jgi:hypothetical protein
VIKSIPEVTNLLVWVNDGCGDPEEDCHKVSSSAEDDKTGGEDDNKDRKGCLRTDLLRNMLKDSVESYYVVYDAKDFQGEIRNPYYTDLLILGDYNPIEDHYKDEIREKIYSGSGLISSLWMSNGDVNDDLSIFGIRQLGELPAKEQTIHSIESPITIEGRMTVQGKVAKIETGPAVMVVGWLSEEGERKESSTGDRNGDDTDSNDDQKDDRKEGKGQEYPAITLNEYGNGKAVYFAFDMGNTLDEGTYDRLADLVRKSIAYAHKPSDTTLFAPYQLAPVKLTMRGPWNASILRLTETYPADLMLYDPEADKWITNNPWSVDATLAPNEIKNSLFYVLTPNKDGAYTLQTEVGYLDKGYYNFYENVQTVIKVDGDIATMGGDIISALKALHVSGKEKAKINETIKYITNVLDRSVADSSDREKNISDLLKAAAALTEIESADTSGIRLSVDKLLRLWEANWYINSGEKDRSLSEEKCREGD